MTPPRMTADDVGGYYIDARGEVWKLIGYADLRRVPQARPRGRVLIRAACWVAVGWALARACSALREGIDAFETTDYTWSP